MSKHLLSWVIALSFSLVFVSTTILYAYWTVMHAAWWLCSLSALALFVQGACYFLWGLALQGRLDCTRLTRWCYQLQDVITYYVMLALNRLLNKTLHLNVITSDTLIDLLEKTYDLAFANNQIARLEAELEELLVSQESEVQNG
jgi:hypothetical protein